MTQEIYWELLAWLFRSFLAVTAFAFVKNRGAGGRFTVRHGMPSRFLREMFLTLWGIEEFRGCAPSYLGGPS